MEVSEEKRITDNEITDSIKTKVSSFPNMPRAAVKLRTLLKKDDVQVDEIANILRQDPGLTTNVLRLANSAHFGLSQKVGSLKQAVMLLGVKRFEQIAISACLFQIRSSDLDTCTMFLFVFVAFFVFLVRRLFVLFVL